MEIPVGTIFTPEPMAHLQGHHALHHALHNKRMFRGEGTKHKMRLVLDIATPFWKRKQEANQSKCVRFAGVDTSPQHG